MRIANCLKGVIYKQKTILTQQNNPDDIGETLEQEGYMPAFVAIEVDDNILGDNNPRRAG